jgi:hypothetical protein
MLGTSQDSVKSKWNSFKVTCHVHDNSSLLFRSLERYFITKMFFFKSQENAIEASVWTKKDDEELIKWVGRFGGKNWGHVAAKLGRSVNSVRSRYNR